jgi:alpha-D-ribose 1-methylphosphonate 5-triphosphate diphosphatase
MPLEEAWAMISSNAADVLRLSDRGVIDYGKRADLVVINEETRAIEATISQGRITHLRGEAACRFTQMFSAEVPVAAE